MKRLTVVIVIASLFGMMLAVWPGMAAAASAPGRPNGRKR